MAEPSSLYPKGNVVDRLRDAIFRVLAEREQQGPPTKERENEWVHENMPLWDRMKFFQGKVDRGELMGAPMVATPGGFGSAARTVNMRAPSALADTKILDTFVRQAPDAIRQLSPDALRRILVGAGAAAYGTSAGLLGSALYQGSAARGAEPPPPTPFAVPRPTAEQKPEMIEPIAEYPISTRRRKGR